VIKREQVCSKSTNSISNPLLSSHAREVDADSSAPQVQRKQILWYADPNRVALVSRCQLAHNLLLEAARHPSISIYFGASPVAIDVTNKTINFEFTSSHKDNSTLVLEHLLHQHPPHKAAHDTAGALERSAAELSAGEEHVGSRHSGDSSAATEVVAEPGKLMSTTRMAGMQTAIALQAQQDSDDELPEQLQYDFLVAADGALSKV
jgi:hypothetical protein